MMIVDTIALILVIIGGLNWGVLGIAGVNMVAKVLGVGSPASKIVYDLVGLGALWMIWVAIRMAKK
jgi:uncharacterized membrane protein YuzA (DUF378 family)